MSLTSKTCLLFLFTILSGSAANSQSLVYRPGGVIFNKKIIIPGVKQGSAKLAGSDIVFSSVYGQQYRLTTHISPDELARIAYVVAKNGGIAITQDYIEVAGDEIIHAQGFKPVTTIAAPALYGTSVLKALDRVDSFGGKLFYGVEYFDGSLFSPSVKLPNFMLDVVTNLAVRISSQIARVGFISEFSGHECNPALEMGDYTINVSIEGAVEIAGPIVELSMAPGALTRLGDSVVRSTQDPLFAIEECRDAHRALRVFNTNPSKFLRDIPELSIVTEVAKAVGVLLSIQGTNATPGMMESPEILGGPLTSLFLLNRPDQLMRMCKKIRINSDDNIISYVNEMLKAQNTSKKTVIQYDRLLAFLDCINALGAKILVLQAILELTDEASDNASKKTLQFDLRYQIALAQYSLKQYEKTTENLKKLLTSPPDINREKQANDLLILLETVIGRQEIIHMIATQRTVLQQPKYSDQNTVTVESNIPTLSVQIPTKCGTDDGRTDAILSDAQAEYVNGNYSKSIEMAQLVRPCSPVRASRIIGSAACNLKDLPLVNDSYRMLDAPGRQYLSYVCKRSGISSAGSLFKLEEP